jgi:hypothetical protein
VAAALSGAQSRTAAAPRLARRAFSRASMSTCHASAAGSGDGAPAAVMMMLRVACRRPTVTVTTKVPGPANECVSWVRLMVVGLDP